MRLLGKLTDDEQAYAGACLAEYHIAALEGCPLGARAEADAPVVPPSLSEARTDALRGIVRDMVAQTHPRGSRAGFAGAPVIRGRRRAILVRLQSRRSRPARTQSVLVLAARDAAGEDHDAGAC